MIINANALHIPLADKCVHTIVTSPPYYGLRDYGTAKWIGGDDDCEHKVGRFTTPCSDKQRSNGGSGDIQAREICPHCGAIRQDSQLGLEPTPDEYIANLVSVFRECKRVLRDDGTLWVNIGDSYASNGCYINAWMEKESNKDKHHLHSENYDRYADRKAIRGGEGNIKGKDLIGIPWMLAFALRADGWYLRSDIIWAKKNCMPESVKDRPTKSHEYIFLLSKSQKYYYDSEAVKTPTQGPEHDKHARVSRKRFPTDKVSGIRAEGFYPMANLRDVWHVSTRPYKGAHYATFNPELITPCILAGAPEGGIVFDPFVGSGTTVATAIQLGRRGIGLDLSMKYLRENAKERIDSVRLPLFV